MAATLDVHEQTRIKVNAFVDCGVAPLVEALNEVPEIMTCSSCEGRNNEDAWVAFIVGESLKELADYVEQLSARLGEVSAASELSFRLTIEWYAGGNTPSAYLRVPRQHVKRMAEIVHHAFSVN